MSKEKKYPDHPAGNCQKCVNTYGTLGCCSTVGNEWHYYCEEGQAEWEKIHNQKMLSYVTLSRDEAEMLFHHLELYIIQEVRDIGDDYDNMEYLATLCDIYKRCKAAADEADSERKERKK